MRQRSFEIVRLPELAKTSFLFNNVKVSYVATCPETGISFFCATEYPYGVKVYPNGRKVLENQDKICWAKKHGKAVYMRFRHAFGKNMGIEVSHAVWMAADNNFPHGMTIDHIDGCTTDNRLQNLRCIDGATNSRDGGFLTKLRNRGFNPVCIPRHILLTYFDRMAVIKPALGWRYRKKLNANDLHVTLFCSDDTVIQHFSDTYNIHLQF